MFGKDEETKNLINLFAYFKICLSTVFIVCIIWQIWTIDLGSDYVNDDQEGVLDQILNFTALLICLDLDNMMVPNVNIYLPRGVDSVELELDPENIAEIQDMYPYFDEKGEDADYKCYMCCEFLFKLTAMLSMLIIIYPQIFIFPPTGTEEAEISAPEPVE